MGVRTVTFHLDCYNGKTHVFSNDYRSFREAKQDAIEGPTDSFGIKFGGDYNRWVITKRTESITTVAESD